VWPGTCRFSRLDPAQVFTKFDRHWVVGELRSLDCDEKLLRRAPDFVRATSGFWDSSPCAINSRCRAAQGTCRPRFSLFDRALLVFLSRQSSGWGIGSPGADIIAEHAYSRWPKLSPWPRN